MKEENNKKKAVEKEDWKKLRDTSLAGGLVGGTATILTHGGIKKLEKNPLLKGDKIIKYGKKNRNLLGGISLGLGSISAYSHYKYKKENKKGEDND